MGKLLWDQTGERFYETGVKNGVLYPRNTLGLYPAGVPWNGLMSVTESPTGAEATPLYADDIKYLNLLSNEEFGASVEAYTYPDEFADCNGESEIADGVMVGQQARRPFGMAFKTVLGNDTDGNEYGYKLHLIYNALAAPSERAYSTINDSPEAITFSWELTTSPEMVTGKKPTASIVIDSTKADAAKLAALEAVLFGVDSNFPSPDASGLDADMSTHDAEAEGFTYFATDTMMVYTRVTATPGTWDAGVAYVAEVVASLPLPDAVAAIFA